MKVSTNTEEEEVGDKCGHGEVEGPEAGEPLVAPSNVSYCIILYCNIVCLGVPDGELSLGGVGLLGGHELGLGQGARALGAPVVGQEHQPVTCSQGGYVCKNIFLIQRPKYGGQSSFCYNPLSHHPTKKDHMSRPKNVHITLGKVCIFVCEADL